MPRGVVLAGLLVAAVLAVGVLWGDGPARVVRAVLDAGSLERVEALAPEIRASAEEFGLDPCLVAGVVYCESRGRPDAVSRVGALGLMQLMPDAVYDAARALGIEEPTRAELLEDGALNLRLGSRQLAWTLRHEHGDVERALVAYNAGRARLAGWIRAAGSYAAWREERLEAGDSQVLAYARKVLESAETFRSRGVVVPPEAAPVDLTDRRSPDER